MTTDTYQQIRQLALEAGEIGAALQRIPSGSAPHQILRTALDDVLQRIAQLKVHGAELTPEPAGTPAGREMH